MADPTNYLKHISKNPIQKFLIQNFNNNIFKILKPLKIASILDAGCGEGFTLVQLQRNKIGKKYEGLEYSKTSIKLAHKMYPGLPITHGSIYEMPYKDNAFDVIICTEVLEHLEDPNAALEEMKRVSREFLLLSVPNEPIFQLSNFLRGKYLKNFGNHPEHINHWSTLSFKKLVRKHKLKVVQTKTPFPWTMLLVRV